MAGGPFREQLLGWGLDEVDGGQDNEDGRSRKCFLPAIREALVAERRGYATTALRQVIRRQLTLPEWARMADPDKAATEGLLVREDFHRMADPSRADLTWTAFLANGGNPGGVNNFCR